MKDFFWKILILSGILSLIGWGLAPYFSATLYLQFWILLGFFTILTLGVHGIMLRMSSTESYKFNILFLTASSIKLLLYLGCIIIFYFVFGGINWGFILLFFALYLCYTLFELFQVIPYLKGKKSSE